MTFSEASERFELYNWMFHTGRIPKQTFIEQCRKLVVVDHLGVQWAIRPSDGNWYFRDGEEWQRGAPNYEVQPPAPRKTAKKIGFGRRLLVLILATGIITMAGWVISNLYVAGLELLSQLAGSPINISPLLYSAVLGFFMLGFGWLVNWILGKLFLKPR